ncbi:uncharacterized protein N7477_000833 [Penicillium maclennaniae]|uniref:uncharacterized protein n=1 Tax=Penicillium maclennaniae TaxID=1343394 RepID=UPI00253F8E4B|nr:uncharacterized protein N7477_000833 [Penicillium maclennaniae]KAJ5684488.1 hypothetical protein N7477_000833 [Penicillium maclennaniae]
MRTVISTDYVVTDRAGVIENRHAVHAAIVDANGHLLYSVGDPSRVTLARSAAKPAQALAIVQTGALEKFNLDEADLALICASHSSEERHISRARNILDKIGAQDEDLRCGGHVPISKEVNRTWIKTDFTPTAICSNCSGKHAGMIAGTKALGADVQTYHLPTNLMQVKVKEAVDQVCGLTEGESKWGLDGCNLPAPAFPLHRLARMYAVFAAGASEDNGNSTDSMTRSLSRIFKAMSRHPEMVAGDKRFCTILMTAFEGILIGKLGADGCYGIGVKASEQTKKLGSNGALGIAVKIEDGNIDILYSAVVDIVEQLQIGEPRMRQTLAHFRTWEIKNTVGVVTGHVVPRFKLRPLS